MKKRKAPLALRIAGYLFSIGTVAFVIVAVGVGYYLWTMTRDMPDYAALKNYEPPVMTRTYASDGQLLAEYASERRLYIPIQAVPELVINAFLSAEDKNFYSHPGVDVMGLARAAKVFAENEFMGGNKRLQGGSTITQQVAKNFLLTNERSIERKAKEAILSFRIESTYSKDRILELYLNEINLGFRSYGIAAAALNYFDKSVHELELHEAAYLAALPKAPENYNPYRNREAALTRRDWVIDRMVENGFATVEEGEIAKAKDLSVNPRPLGTRIAAAEYFAEEVRREVGDLYGTSALNEGGLTIRTSLDPRMQQIARDALAEGLVGYDRERGYRGPVTQISVGADWGIDIAKVDELSDVDPWRLAVVLKVGDGGAEIGLRPRDLRGDRVAEERETGTVTSDGVKWTGRSVGKALAAGDVVYVSPREDGTYTLQQVPEVQGALTAMDTKTGRVLAMVGGFSFDQSVFNRATQAQRQPGSSFKPLIYAAALDNGYSPTSIILDAPVEFPDGRGGVWRPKNYGGKSAGPSTLRRGIEKSRNLMTVRLANDLGMPLVAEYSRRFGVYDNLTPVLANALGAGETTVLKMTAAYATIANGGQKITPTLIDRVQDRYGKTVYRHDQRECRECNLTDWHPQDEPTLVDQREFVLDPMTAYQITSIMEGVVQRGTATILKDLERPIAGKTGTTNDEKDALVHRLHARHRGRRLCRLRPAQAHGPRRDRRRTGRADRQGVHARGAGQRAAQGVRAAGGHEFRRGRPQFRPALVRRRCDPRSLQAGHVPDLDLFTDRLPGQHGEHAGGPAGRHAGDGWALLSRTLLPVEFHPRMARAPV